MFSRVRVFQVSAAGQDRTAYVRRPEIVRSLRSSEISPNVIPIRKGNISINCDVLCNLFGRRPSSCCNIYIVVVENLAKGFRRSKGNRNASCEWCDQQCEKLKVERKVYNEIGAAHLRQSFQVNHFRCLFRPSKWHQNRFKTEPIWSKRSARGTRKSTQT